ncbi:MAG: hypothetical protein RBG13Loki_4124, partial [Promethearchaeota archaeon CR_4]
DQNNNSESSQEKAKTWWEKIFIDISGIK